MITDLIINSLFAPGYSATTFTLGGDIEGNWVTGNLRIASTPRKTMMSDITIERTGLCINLLNIEICYLN
jgi:hypothetical protein